MHVVMRQNLVPRISFHAKYEVAVPNPAGNVSSYERCRHMIVEFLAASECMPQCGQNFVWPLKNLRDWIDESLIIARLMSFDGRSNRCHDVHRAALFREKNLNARACGLYRFDKDQFVFVRNDHGAQAASLLFFGSMSKTVAAASCGRRRAIIAHHLYF